MANEPINTAKTRHNISMREDIRARGEKLAELDKRSFSNLLEVLIDKEYERRFQTPPQPQPAAA